MKNLLAEAAYQGRDFATAVRCSAHGDHDRTTDEAQEMLAYERSALHGAIRRRIFDKQPGAISWDNQKAVLAAAEAAFLQRMTGES